MPQETRHPSVPSANSPQLLTRMLEVVGRGVRSTRGLQEALAVQPQTVRAYAQAGEWLGLLETAGGCWLTQLGLEYVYAGRQRSYVYSRAVWSNPFAAELLVASEGRRPTLEVVRAAIARSEPELAPATVRRKASAIRSLIAPALGRPRPRSRTEEERQIALPLATAPRAPAAAIPVRGGREYNPDVYRLLLAGLLDYGELTLGQMRALLDRSGAADAPVGGYVDMALSRGDAVRIGDTLAVTPSAVRRRALVGTTTSIILSDPRYRAYLDDLRAAGDDREAGARRDAVAGRYRAWDRRLLGREIAPETLDRDLEAVLLDRPLESFPIAQPAADPLPVADEPFLDVWERGGLRICAPPYLTQLEGGVQAVNRLLRRARTRGDVAPPDLAHRPLAVHGGILHPEEPLLRAVPDLRSLRLRVLMHAPYPALIGALLSQHRRHSETLAIARGRSGWALLSHGAELGPLLTVLDAFCAARGWHPSRRATGGVDAAGLLRVMQAVGITTEVGRHAVLAERFFGMLTLEAEEMEVNARLQPLSLALHGWLEGVEPEDFR